MIATIAICLAIASQTAESEARHRFQLARKHHELGRFEEAVAEYLLVYELKPIPDVLFNVGQCYRNLGDEKRAIFFFERYMREAKRPKEKARVEKLIRELESALAVEEVKTASVAALPPEREEPEPELDVLLPESPPPIEDPPSIAETWWFWTTIGVAAALVAGGTAAAFTLARDTPEGSYATIDAR